MKRLALHWQIIIGMILGVFFGILAYHFSLNNFTNDWIKPFGVIFVNLLKLIAVPLVFASLIKGVASLSDISRLSKIGSRSIILYLFSTILSVSLGLGLVNLVGPGNSFSDDKKIELREKYSSKAGLKINDANTKGTAISFNKLTKITPKGFIQSLVKLFKLK